MIKRLFKYIKRRRADRLFSKLYWHFLTEGKTPYESYESTKLSMNYITNWRDIWNKEYEEWMQAHKDEANHTP